MQGPGARKAGLPPPGTWESPGRGAEQGRPGLLLTRPLRATGRTDRGEDCGGPRGVGWGGVKNDGGMMRGWWEGSRDPTWVGVVGGEQGCVLFPRTIKTTTI